MMYRAASLPAIAVAILLAAELPGGEPTASMSAADAKDIESLRLALEDLQQTYPDRYPRGAEFLAQLDGIQRRMQAAPAGARGDLRQLRRTALLLNPLLGFERLIVLQRKRGQLGLPTNHQCNTALDQFGYENRIAALAPRVPGGPLETVFRPADGAYVGEIDLDYDAGRLLFTMPNGRTWQIHEIGVDGSGLRQVSREDPDVDNFDGCYLPDGRIAFASTAAFTGVPCWHGRQRACCLYLMDRDGSQMRQLCFDQDLDLHPAVLTNGQIVYSRWDYTGIMHVYLRPLMVMNPDGTQQRAVYGSNSYYPNSLFFPRAIPGAPTKLAAILAGYHGPNRMGELVVLDTSRGWRETEGILHRIGHRGEPIVPVIRDNLIGDSWPKYLHPYPLSDKYFLAAAQLHAKAPWGIYLVDIFDNLLPLTVDPDWDFFEPLPLVPRARPPVIPDRTDPSSDEATVYLHNVYAGPGLAGVPAGSVKRLRIVAYDYGYPGLAGPDKIGRAGPWEAMRILGTVPVYADGSASFRVPACTPISVQPLDAQGKALALMRSWYAAMPGEQAACVGCHEHPSQTPAVRSEQAAGRPPVEIQPWYGPPRGFDFEREVQPVLDRHCADCHSGQPRDDGLKISDLRAERFVADYQGLPLSQLGASRLDPLLKADLRRFPPHRSEHPLIGDRCMLYTPAYEALIPFIRRVNIEDYVGLHVAGEYHADTSELVQLLQKGHYGVQLDQESWDRLITWIDLNGPCHGTWGDIGAVPGGADLRRRELAARYGGPPAGPAPAEALTARTLPQAELSSGPPPADQPPPQPALEVSGWPFDAGEARRRQRAGGPWEQAVDLGGGVTLRLVQIPPGEFVMGSCDGPADESPQTRVRIPQPFWISDCEISNEQLRVAAPEHLSGYFTKRSLSMDGPGIALDHPRQPAVRVSWQQAVDFCRWLSRRTGREFRLPTEAEWEYACRAGSSQPMFYGETTADFSAWANMADSALQRINTGTGGVVVLQDFPVDGRYDDGAIATREIGGYAPNAWDLYDMHGNAAEWTSSVGDPGHAEDDSPGQAMADRKVVRGGSFHDRPQRCRSAFRLSYPAWQRVHDVGFRVVCSD